MISHLSQIRYECDSCPIHVEIDARVFKVHVMLGVDDSIFNCKRRVYFNDMHYQVDPEK